MSTPGGVCDVCEHTRRCVCDVCDAVRVFRAEGILAVKVATAQR